MYFTVKIISKKNKIDNYYKMNYNIYHIMVYLLFRKEEENENR